jgi:hypothetical protein
LIFLLWVYVIKHRLAESGSSIDIKAFSSELLKLKKIINTNTECDIDENSFKSLYHDSWKVIWVAQIIQFQSRSIIIMQGSNFSFTPHHDSLSAYESQYSGTFEKTNNNEKEREKKSYKTTLRAYTIRGCK